MTDITKSATAIRELSLVEMDAVTGGLTALERLALKKKLTDAYLSHQESELGKKIEDRFEAGFGH
jgi:hypothetical protein